MTAIILLNWNGADDTIECLESLAKVYGDFYVVVVDNCSADNSVERINDWIENHKDLQVYLLEENENHGFAKGNNVGLKFASRFAPDYYMLLNNDTEVETDFLDRLVGFAESHSEYKALTPKINYFYDKSKVWLCGGQLTFGSRKRFFHDVYDTDVPNRLFVPVTFISGCALFFHKSLLDTEGCLLSERFFFGEEDYEFSLRMKKQNVKMACVFDSVIYHKVGASRDKIADERKMGKDYSYYLGKLICCRLYYSPLKYAVIKLLTLPNCLCFFYISSSSVKKTLDVTMRLMEEADTKDGISRDDFQNYMLY
ncbi:MAG: glycosyltransferase family 2 protein [Prevotellaceae bacterium]|nr:glycosyltransferase family 2 protein [Prevotellaceae bacterium]